jgi:hypothetical protein
MKHAGQATLDALDDLLVQLRALGGLREKARGVFYLRSRAFLHFHEDPTGLYADLRAGADFERFKVDGLAQQHMLVQSVRERLRHGE